MSRNHQMFEDEYYEECYGEEYFPHDTLSEMKYHARKQNEEKNVVKVAKAVLVVACIGLICAIIDYYVEQI